MNDLEILALITKGYLTNEARSDPKAIKAAIETLVSDLAFELRPVEIQRELMTAAAR